VNKKFLFNKVVNWLFKPNLPENAEECAIALYSSLYEGNHHYIKLIPCKKYGLFPEIGTVTKDELKEIDRKFIESQNKKTKEFLAKIGIGTIEPSNDNEDGSGDNNGGRLLN
jgi:hypothetical protein